MNIEPHKDKINMSLQEFADEHNLTLEMHERTGRDFHGLPRFYCHFKHADVKQGGCLYGKFGQGSTEVDAMKDYIKEIRETILVIDAWAINPDDRHEIVVPNLYIDEGNINE